MLHLGVFAPFVWFSGEAGAAVGLVGWTAAGAVESLVGEESPGEVPAFEMFRGTLLFLTLVVGLLLAAPGHPDGLLWLVAGSALRVWSIRTLGNGFSAQYAPVVERIQHGPYRWLRHPSEVGLVVQALGFTRLCGVSVVWTVLLVGLPSLGRVLLEERVLRR